LWFILSAKHGLVEPAQVLAPYDLALHRLDRSARQAWACRVVEQLRQRGLLDSGHRFLLHAGADYAEPLATLLPAEQPRRGLGIGRRLSWYRRRLAALAATETPMTKTLHLPALEVRQGDHILSCFAVDGKQLHLFTAVSRVHRSEEGGVLG